MSRQAPAKAIVAIGIGAAAALAPPFASAFDLGTTVDACTTCHGKDGASAIPEIPTIGGYSADYISGALQAYAKKERPCREAAIPDGPRKGERSDMCKSVSGLGDSDMEKLGKYFEGKKFARASQPSDPALAQKGKEIHDSNCDKCHLEAGTVKSDDAGILAGQHVQYLRTQFEDMKAGKRNVPKRMKPKIDALKPEEIDALLNFYASFK